MAADAELLIDRRRLRRRLSLWRVLGVGGLIVAVGALGYRVQTGAEGGFAVRPQIARISVSGFIAGSEATAKLMKRVGDADAVKGVVVSINSPGGTTTGSEEIFRNLRALAAKKPIVAFVDGTAASGAYITAIAADHIVARETSLVGSIGVLFQYPDVSGLLDKVGVKVESVKSSPLKAEPSGFTPTRRRRAPPWQPSSATPMPGSRTSWPSAVAWIRASSTPSRTAGSSAVARACR